MFDPNTPIAHIVDEYERLWREARDAHVAFEAAATSIYAAERPLIDRRGFHGSVFSAPKDSADAVVRGICTRIVGALALHAQKTFAIEGGAFQVDQEAICAMFAETGGDRLTPFSVGVAWSAIEARYGGSAGRDLALMNAALRLMRFFRLEAGAQVSRVKGYVQLDAPIGTEQEWRATTRKLTYDACRALGAALTDLRLFLSWAEIALSDRDLAAFASLSAVCDMARHNRVEHRRRHSGDAIEVIEGYAKFSFRLRSDVADRLNEFLGAYAMNTSTRAA